MEVLELLLLSIGLAMDAFSISICKGLSIKKYTIKKGITIGIYFGLFQTLMPLIGFLLGTSFEKIITNIDHWIVFILLFTIGINMIKDSFSKNSLDEKMDFKSIFPFAIATSIDALAVGITFAFLKVNILIAILSIGIITFILSVIGTKIGNTVGIKYKKRAQIFGGIILILIGTKILLEHLGILII